MCTVPRISSSIRRSPVAVVRAAFVPIPSFPDASRPVIRVQQFPHEVETLRGLLRDDDAVVEDEFQVPDDHRHRTTARRGTGFDR